MPPGAAPRLGAALAAPSWALCGPGGVSRRGVPAGCPGAGGGAGHTYLGCCRALAPRAGAHPRRSPPHALRGHGARRALRRRPLPHPPLPGVAGAAWGCPPHGAALPLHRLFNNLPPFAPAGDFFPLESHGRGGQGKGETL